MEHGCRSNLEIQMEMNIKNLERMNRAAANGRKPSMNMIDREK
jgi:hypothetical protein